MRGEQADLPGVPEPPPPADPTPAPPRAAPRLKGAGDRAQCVLRPVVVEALIPDDHSARAIWAFVGQLDLQHFTAPIQAVDGTAGRPAWDPHLLISLWVYSYSQGVSSARAIARRCAYHPAYQWLTGMVAINAHTLSDFRVAHGPALQELFVQVLALLQVEGLMTFERVMQDGTKIRASAASKRFRRQPRIAAALAEARALVAALETQPEESASRQQQRARERAARDRTARLEAALEAFAKLEAAKSRLDRVSTTDPDARLMQQPNGGRASSYNVQVSTDAAQGLIVGVAATTAGSDYHQLTPALDRLAQAGLPTPAQIVVDGGYVSNETILAMATRGPELIGPAAPADPAAAQRQKAYRRYGVQPDYEASRFVYEATTDTYRCPEGKPLTDDAKEQRGGTTSSRYKAAARDCHACPAKPACCPRTQHGRSIQRSEPLPEIAAFRAKMQTDEARAIYRTRAPVAEFPNLWIKAKFGLWQFSVRGLAKVEREALWAALTYNIQQWIRLRWRPQQPAVLASA